MKFTLDSLGLFSGRIKCQALNDEINNALYSLYDQHNMREHLGVRIQLKAMVNNIPCVKEEITAAKLNNASTTRLVQIVAEAIVKGVDGRLSVPNYIFNQGADQEVQVYNDRCWEKLEPPVLLDFITDAAQKAGLTDEEVKTPKLMQKICERVAFSVKHEWHPYIPQGQEWINLQNGTLEIYADGSVMLREHNKADYFTYALPYSYDPCATCEKWQAFLDRVIPDKDTQLTLAMYIAYCLVRKLKLSKLLILFGEGSNGKSVILDVCSYLFGRGNVSYESLVELTQSDEKRAQIENKLVNISHECQGEMNNDTFKKLISGEPVTAKELYHNTHTMYVYPKFMISSNVMPRPELTHGWLRRIIIIKMMEVIKEEEQDVELTDKLLNELPGILNWVINALKMLMKSKKIFESDSCKTALEHYKLQSDNVRLFVQESCDTECNVGDLGSELYNRYKGYCYNDGFKPIGKQKFYNRLVSLGFKRVGDRVPRFNIKYNG